MTTETTDPLEESVCAALLDVVTFTVGYDGESDVPLERAAERLRLHVLLALAKARWEMTRYGQPAYDVWRDKIAALEARLQEE